MDSFCNLVVVLDKLDPQSLSLTKEVLKERNELEAAVEGIKENIDLSLNTLDQLKKEEEVLKKHQDDMEKNKDFTYEEVVQVVEEKPTTFGRYAVNCKVCNVTCHSACRLSKEEAIVGCTAMDTNGHC